MRCIHEQFYSFYQFILFRHMGADLVEIESSKENNGE